MNTKLFTIGYANKPLELFIKMLKDKKIDCIIDVRSSPFSKQYPEYNKFNIVKILKENNIKYGNFDCEFGARRSENEAYSTIDAWDGEIYQFVDFEKVYKLKNFIDGVNRIHNALEMGLNICFMCSEKEAFMCHRAIMVGQYFYQQNINITHLIDVGIEYEHTHIFIELESIFLNEKKRFQKKYHNELLYSGDLFSMISNKKENFINKWSEFFNSYSMEKGIYLQNILIGYKKGDDNEE